MKSLKETGQSKDSEQMASLANLVLANPGFAGIIAADLTKRMKILYSIPTAFLEQLANEVDKQMQNEELGWQARDGMRIARESLRALVKIKPKLDDLCEQINLAESLEELEHLLGIGERGGGI